LVRDEWTWAEYDFLCELWIHREEPPVYEASVSEIWIFTLFSDVFEEIL
jgi:hypothetical protein